MEDDHLDVGGQHRPQSFEYRLGGCCGAFKGYQDSPERAGNDRVRRHDHNRLIGVLENVVCGAADRPRAAWGGSGTDDRDEHLWGPERGEQGRFHRAFEHPERHFAPGGQRLGRLDRFDPATTDVDRLHVGSDQLANPQSRLEHGPGGRGGVESGEDDGHHGVLSLRGDVKEKVAPGGSHRFGAPLATRTRSGFSQVIRTRS